MVMMQVAFISGAVFLGVLFIFLGWGLRTMARTRVDVLADQYLRNPLSLEQVELSQPFAERVLRPMVRGMARLLNRFAPQRNLDGLRHQLDLAGNPFNWTVVDFVGVRGFAAVFVGLIMLAVAFALRAPGLWTALLVLAGAGLGFYFPSLWLVFTIKERQRQILRSLPDALDLLTISVEAGLGLDAALARVVEKWNNPLSRAFARMLAEVRVGKLRREALRDMANRMDVSDVTSFVAAVIQADQLGVSIAQVLRVQSEQLRIKRRQRAQEAGNQAPIKMLFPLAFLIFPSIFIVVVGPAAVYLITHGLLGR
jgi:tight adherence protein C